MLYIHTLIYVKCNWFQVCCVILFIDLFLCVQRWHSHYHYHFQMVFIVFFLSFFLLPSKHLIFIDLLYRPVSKSSNHLFVTIVLCVFILSALKIVVFMFFLFLFVCLLCRQSVTFCLISL